MFSLSPCASAPVIYFISCIWWFYLCRTIYLMRLYPLSHISTTYFFVVLIIWKISVVPHIIYHHYHWQSSTCVSDTKIIVLHLLLLSSSSIILPYLHRHYSFLASLLLPLLLFYLIIFPFHLPSLRFNPIWSDHPPQLCILNSDHSTHYPLYFLLSELHWSIGSDWIVSDMIWSDRIGSDRIRSDRIGLDQLSLAQLAQLCSILCSYIPSNLF